MNIGIAVNYFKRIYSEVTELSRQTGYNRFYHLWDYLTAFVRHGAHIDQYIAGGFWSYSNPQQQSSAQQVPDSLPPSRIGKKV